MIPDFRPQYPADKPAVAILGCGNVARTAHLPAYRNYGVPVAGVFSLGSVDDVLANFPEVGRSYATVEELLADEAVGIVDIATGPKGRVELIEQAVRAGKHVLAQKPVVDNHDDLARLMAVMDEADAAGIRVAVNQNARWAPAWRLATQLVASGAIGEVVGVTHLHDKPLPPIADTPFDDVDHMLISDYLMHWIDITVQWLQSPVTKAIATDSRVPGQPADAKNPWSATVQLGAESGATALLRVVGNAVAAKGGCPFWIHGTEGTVRGSLLLNSDRVTLESGATTTDYKLEGQWFVDGFAGTMGELMSAIAEDREPENSARTVAASVAVMLAATESARRGGEPVSL